MLHRKTIAVVLVAGWSAATCLFAAGSALGVCTQVACDSRPATVASYACLGPCLCVPPSPWGYTTRLWAPWPGDQYRQDIVFPQSLGVEQIAAPRGEKPKPLPRETYVKQKTKAERDREAASGIQIREGAPAESIEMPVPFDVAPEAN